MSIIDISAEGGWKDSEMVKRYTHDRPFEELQAMPTPLTAMLRKRASASDGSTSGANQMRCVLLTESDRFFANQIPSHEIADVNFEQ